MLRSNTPKALVAASATLVFALAMGEGGSAQTPFPRGAIQHIVFVIQENRSVDNLFNGFPGADTVRIGHRHDGSTVTLHPVSLDEPTDVDHARDSFLNAYAHGRADGFDLNGTEPAQKNGDFPYAYVPEAEVDPYWTLARRYTFADRTFESAGAPSFSAHQYLISGQAGRVVSNPSLLEGATYFWGCDSPPGTRVFQIGSDGQADGPKIFPCFTYRTLADSLDAAGRSWRDYGPTPSDVGNVWSAFDAIRQIRFGGDWGAKIVSPETRFLSDVRAGALADVTWVTPDFRASDHPQYGLKQHRVAGGQRDLGPEWVANVVNAVGRSRYWSTTAIVVVWDDWGGWYDHVPPPQLDALGLGFRVPMIVIGPYAKHGYVSHVRHEFGSLLKFAEEVFALPSLGTTDVRADDLADCFDFRQRRRPLVEIPTKLGPEDFLGLRPSEVPPDDD